MDNVSHVSVNVCEICETCTDKTSIDCHSQQRRRLHMNSKTQFIHSQCFTSIARKITITNTRLSRMCSHQSMGETTTGFCIEIVQFPKQARARTALERDEWLHAYISLEQTSIRLCICNTLSNRHKALNTDTQTTNSKHSDGWWCWNGDRSEWLQVKISNFGNHTKCLTFMYGCTTDPFEWMTTFRTIFPKLALNILQMNAPNCAAHSFSEHYKKSINCEHK